MTIEEVKVLQDRLINLSDDQKASILPGIFLAIKNEAKVGDKTAIRLMRIVNEWIEIVGGD